MKIIPALLLSIFIACCMLLAPAHSAPASALATLRPEHPRLLFTARDWADFEQRVQKRAGDPPFDALMSQLETNARALLVAPPLERRMTGYRLLHVSREALRRITTLAIVYRSTGDEAFLQRAEKEMLAAAAFSDWNPSHFLDVAEMTAALALGYDWLFEKLPASSRATIRDAIIGKGIRQGVDPKTPHNRWHRNENNWNQVCFGGLSLGALAVAEDAPELACAMLDAARAGIAHGLKPYAPDGIYPEGPGYWSYGTSYQVLLVAALESALGTDWDLLRSPGFMASASAQLQLTGPSGMMFNFSDCGAKRLYDPALFWFAKKLDNPALVTAPLANPETDRFLPLTALWWPEKTIRPDAGNAPSLPLAWKGEGQNAVAVFRSSWTDPGALYLACKAGAANVSHGHMDAGSFIFEADGVRWAIDLGMQDYESLESKGMHIFGRAQDAQRWTIFRMNNLSHNTLTLDGQPHQVDGRAEFVKFWDERDSKMDRDWSAGVRMDLSPVFAGTAGKVYRQFTFFSKSRRVFILDEMEGLKPNTDVRWAMVTKAQVRIHPDGDYAELHQNGKILRLSLPLVVIKEADQRFEVIPADPPKNDYDAPNPNTRILIVRSKAATDGKAAFFVEMQAEPPK